MSIYTQATATPPRQGIPPVIQTGGSNTSALTPDQSHRLLLEERIRHDKEQQSLRKQISDLQRSIATTSATSYGTATSATPSERIMKKDSQGHKWFQVAHYCSKHGYNHSHSNNRCRDKNKQQGNPWTAVATDTDHKGGSNLNAEHRHHWFNPHTRQYSPTLP